MRKINVKIYQCPTWCKWCFFDWEFAKGHEFSFKDYYEVAEFSMEEYESNEMVLERIFKLGNDYTIKSLCNREFMRSVSVSDIIMLDDKMYYVDSLGFKEM